MRYGRLVIGLAALCVSLLCQATARADHNAAAAAVGASGSDTSAWTVIFRSDDPKLWNTDAGNPSQANGFAVGLDAAPEGVRYLRLRRLDSGDAVIVAIGREQLPRTVNLDSELIWIGNAAIRGPQGNQNKLLGIARRSWATKNQQDDLVGRAPKKLNSGFRGWGFSKAASPDPSQSYSWAGQRIDKTVFEIAVKGGELTHLEELSLLSFGPDAAPRQGPARQKPGSSLPDAQSSADLHESLVSRPTTRPAKLQTSIEALYVVPQDTGGMLGLASRFILTATPGAPGSAEGSTPVSFATPVGPEMHMVLDDVLRAINLKYGVSGVSKVELSFEDKYTAKDGGSIGAAIGTLILSMIQGFDIDPNLAITGDVSADGKIRRIGGVAAKLRGAAEAQCKLVAVPAENYEQVQDALAYEGPGIFANVQVLGIGDLEEAMAIVRSDRDPKLAQAIDLFAQIQQAMGKSSAYIYGRDAHAKLTQVLALAPNHYSAKLLLMVNGRNLPRLSARASEYYTFVAVESMWETMHVQAQAGATPQLTAAATDAALKELHKLRPLADLRVQPYVDAWIDFIQGCDQLRQGTTTWQMVETKHQALLNEGIKLDANRDLAEKMLHEGI